MKYNINNAQIDTFESWYRNVRFANNALIIPYVSLGINADSIGQAGNDLIYFKYSYLVFEHLNNLSVYIENRRFLVVGDDLNDCQYAAGGNYLDFENHIFNDMYIVADLAFVIIPDFAKQSYIQWNYAEMLNDVHEKPLLDRLFSHQLY